MYNYSMAATNTNTTAVDDEITVSTLEQTVNNVSTAYAATQDSIRNSTISDMQQQLASVHAMCQAIAAQPNRAPMYPNNYGSPNPNYRGNNYNPNHQPSNNGYQSNNYRNNNNNNNKCRGNSNQQGAMYPPGVQPPTNPVKRFENWNYCHTHGFDVDDNYTSQTCTHPGNCHNYAATRNNTMLGSIAGAHKTILPSAVGRQPPAARGYNRGAPMMQPNYTMQQPAAVRQMQQQPVAQQTPMANYLLPATQPLAMAAMRPQPYTMQPMMTPVHPVMPTMQQQPIMQQPMMGTNGYNMMQPMY